MTGHKLVSPWTWLAVAFAIATVGAAVVIVAAVVLLGVFDSAVTGGAEWVGHAYPAYFNAVHQQVQDAQQTGGRQP